MNFWALRESVDDIFWLFSHVEYQYKNISFAVNVEIVSGEDWVPMSISIGLFRRGLPFFPSKIDNYAEKCSSIKLN